MTAISSTITGFVFALGLALAAPVAHGQPRSILPPVLGGNTGDGFQPQPAQPGLQPGQLPGQALGTGQGVLGTLPAMEPAAGLDRTGSGVSGGGVVDGVFAALFSQIVGPMPTAGVQTTMRDLLVDASFRETRGADGLARAQALFRLGFIEDATGAVVQIEGQGITRLAATASMFLALGRTGQACDVADVSDLPKGAAPGPTFALLEILAFCKLEAGDKKAAKLISGVLRDQGGSDALYRALIAGAISGRTTKINTRRAKTLRPIHVALFTRTGRPIPGRLVARADLAVLSGIARNAADPALRLAATERLVAAGLAAFTELDALYAEIAPPDFDPATALKSKAAQTAIGRASIYRLLDEIDDEPTRMALAIAAYEGASSSGAGAAAAVLFSDIVGAIVPRPELARFAAGAARLLFGADRPDLAAGWIAAGEYAENRKARLGPLKAHRLKAIAAILAPDAGFGLGSGALGSDIASVKLSKANRALIADEAQLLAALGDEVPAVLAQLGGGQATGPVEAGPIGPVEAIKALAPLAGAKIGKIKLVSLARAIVALRGLGLEGEARRLAADYLMARF